MQITSFFWWDGPDGNVEHIAEHGLTPEDVEFVLKRAKPYDVELSHRSGLPRVLGKTPGGQRIAVVFEDLGEGVVNPVTAYEVD